MISASNVQLSSCDGRRRPSTWRTAGLFIAGFVVLVSTERLGHGQATPRGDAPRVAPQEFPLPKGVTGLVIDEQQQELRFQTQTPIEPTAKFFQEKMAALGWKPTFEQVASIFANLHYQKDGQRIRIAAKKKDIFKPTVSVTITGDGVAWKGTATPASPPGWQPAENRAPPVSQQAANSANPTHAVIGMKGADFPLLDSQQTMRDGGLEIISFRRTRKRTT